MAIAKFEVVEATEAPKTNKVMSAEEKAEREEYAAALRSLPAGKSLKVSLKEVGGENPARSFGIKLGHIIKDFDMADQFTTTNDGGFYYVTRKATKEAAKGAEKPQPIAV